MVDFLLVPKRKSAKAEAAPEPITNVYYNSNTYDLTPAHKDAVTGIHGVGSGIIAKTSDIPHTIDSASIHGAASDISLFNASVASHGFLRKLDNNSAHFLNGQGSWATPGGQAHSQNTDWILLDADSGNQLFASGRLKKTLYVDNTFGLSADTGILNFNSLNAMTLNSINESIQMTAAKGLRLPLLTSDPAGASKGCVYYHATNLLVRQHNGVAWQNLVIPDHTQNTDWILLNAPGGIAIISSNELRTIMSVSNNCGFSGSGNMYFSNESASFGFVSIRARDILYLTSNLSRIEMTAIAGARLPLLASDPVSGIVEGLVYYNSASNKLRSCDGYTWEDVGGSASFATPAIILGFVAGNGGASTVVRSDCTIAAFDNNYPTTQAFGDSPVIGVAAFAARRDHKHGMMAAPTVNGAVRGVYSAAQRISGANYYNNSYDMLVTVSHYRYLAASLIIHAYVNTVEVAKFMWSGTYGSGFVAFYVPKGQVYSVTYPDPPDTFIWTEYNIKK